MTRTPSQGEAGEEVVTDGIDREQLADALAHLGLGGSAEDATLLSAPYSGTQAYLVRRGDGDVVLKLAATDAPIHARARALREARFFAELAPLIPVRLPLLLAASANPLCLLFAAYPAAPPARAWQPETYQSFASDLADLHAAYWDDEAALARLDWLRPVEPADSAGEADAARGQWSELARLARLADLLTPQVMSMVESLLAAMPELDAARQSLPRCLCHGDCHAGNFLVESVGSASLVWADWQEVGFGCGPEELAFFVQRAMTDGAEVPEATFLGAYHRRLSELVGPIPLEALSRIADASELRTRLLQ